MGQIITYVAWWFLTYVAVAVWVVAGTLAGVPLPTVYFGAGAITVIGLWVAGRKVRGLR